MPVSEADILKRRIDGGIQGALSALGAFLLFFALLFVILKLNIATLF